MQSKSMELHGNLAIQGTFQWSTLAKVKQKCSSASCQMNSNQTEQVVSKQADIKILTM